MLRTVTSRRRERTPEPAPSDASGAGRPPGLGGVACRPIGPPPAGDDGLAVLCAGVERDLRRAGYLR